MDAEVVWLALALVGFMLLDGVACAIPIPPIKKDLDRLHVSDRVQRLIPVLKLAAAGGLLVGLWVPVIGLVTAAAVVGYFIVALWYHAQAQDQLVRYLPAVAVGAWAALVGGLSYAAAL